MSITAAATRRRVGSARQAGAIAAAYAASRTLISSPMAAAEIQPPPWARTSSTATWAAPPYTSQVPTHADHGSALVATAVPTTSANGA